MSSLFCTFLLILEGNFVPLRFQSKVLLSKQTHPTKKKFWLCLMGKIRRKEKQRRKVTERKKEKEKYVLTERTKPSMYHTIGRLAGMPSINLEL